MARERNEPENQVEPEATEAEAEMPVEADAETPAPEPEAASEPEAPAAPGDDVPAEEPEHESGRRQERRGVVDSSAMDRTIVVEVDTIKAHPRYKKVVRRSTKFHAHDERNEAKVGDIVRIVETRPLSKTKYWRLAEVVEAAR